MKLCSFSLFPLLITMKSPCELASVVTHFEFSAFFQLLCWLHLWFKWLSLERVFCFSSLQCWSPAAPCWRFCSLSNRKEYPPTSAWCGLLTRGYSRHSLVDGDTCRKTPISRFALDKIPMPGHLFEDNPFDEGTTLRGQNKPLPMITCCPLIPLSHEGARHTGPRWDSVSGEAAPNSACPARPSRLGHCQQRHSGLWAH